MPVPTFDIFSGSPDGEAMWIEVVCGLGAANDRMQHLATQKPGAYFVFDPTQRTVLAKIDTSLAEAEKERRRA